VTKPNRYERVHELFAAACDLDPDERAALLDRACAGDLDLRREVESMLAQDAGTGSPLDHPAMGEDFNLAAAVTKTAPEAALLGRHIGRYHLKGIIDSGGMGTVYEAVQERPRRIVALKVMRKGIASASALRRFEYESQILGRLKHPYIAQVYEAGTHDDGSGGVPYFAMEYIPNAKTITEYAASKSLSARERLDLFARVCEAIHHGHQKGVIHRDLKPANILIDSSGNPKVIDFGVARATDSDLAVTTLQTDVGQFIGTLQYMSPEQCEADPHDIDTRSDIYALGVVLYELLCEQLPYDVSRAAIHEAARVIREDPPTKPSTINKTLRGDVETITLKAMAKDRERRYRSAIDLSDDIHRYLDSEPIEARPPSAIYKLRRFVARNKPLVAGAATVFVVLVAGIIVSTTLYYRAEAARTVAVAAQEDEKKQREVAEAAQAQAEIARRAEASQRDLAVRRLAETEQALERAETSAAEARAISDFLVKDVLGAARSRGEAVEDITLEEALTNAALNISDAFRDRPSLEASIRFAIGVTYVHLDRPAAAEANLRRYLELRGRLHGADDRRTFEAMSFLAWALMNGGKADEAERLMRDALDGLRRVAGAEDPETIRVLTDYGHLLSDLGRHAEAEVAIREVLHWRRMVMGDDDAYSTGGSISGLGMVLSRQGKWAEAEAVYRDAAGRMRSVLGDNHPETLDVLGRLAWVLSSQGKYDESGPLYRDLWERRRRDQGDDDSETRDALRELVRFLTRQDRADEAEALLRSDLARRRVVYGQQHLNTAESIEALADWLADRGRDDEAEELRAEALEVQRQAPVTDDTNLAARLTDLAIAEHRSGNSEEAEHLVEESIAMQFRAGRDDTDPELARARIFRSLLLHLRGEQEDGERQYAEVLANQNEGLGDIHPETVNQLENSVANLLDRAPDLAHRYMTDVLAARRRSVERPDADALTLNNVAWLLLTCEPTELRDPAAALAMVERAIELDGGEIPMTLDTLAVAYRMTGDLERAIEVERKALALMPVSWSWLREAVEQTLVEFLEEKGDIEGAEQVYRDTLRLRRESQPEGHSDIGTALLWLGWTLNRHEKYAEAENHLREALEIRWQTLPDGHWAISNTMSVLGEAVMGQARYEEAEPLLRQGYVRLKNNPDAHPKRLAEAGARLIRLYELWAKPEKAEQWRRELRAEDGQVPEAP
jgi:tetratricopeptide (TPR) repeat protein